MPRIDGSLRDRVLERLGFSSPPPVTRAGLDRVYGEWCRRVPFDNVQKRIALASEDAAPLPGGRAADFFERWLEHGTGGTCWPSSNALFALLEACGFEARRITAAMKDRPEENHGSVFVQLDGDDWLADTAMLSDRVFALRKGESGEVGPELARIRVEAIEDSWRLWVPFPPRPEPLACRLLADRVDHAHYLQRYEATRRQSPFNHSLYASRNREGARLVWLGSLRVEKTARGLEQEPLEPDALADSLVSELGLSEAIVGKLAQHGALG